jgi:putative Mg2+ transporter-C (MgtC) family protein
MEFAQIAPDMMLGRMCVAFLVGALIGMERERLQRPAGLRTHMLVALASALFAMISITAAGANNDPGRIAAQVVTGIGFLGAGTIMRHGSTVKGLTTAASLWTAAALGLAAGFGWYLAASTGAVMAFLALTVVKHFEDQFAHADRMLQIEVGAVPGQDPLPQVLATIRSLGGAVQRIRFEDQTLEHGLHFVLAVTIAPGCERAVLLQTLGRIEGVRDVEPDK